MKEMRDRYDRAVEADKDNRVLGLDDFRFVTVPGYQWDEAQKKKRRGRPCYEFPLLRSHWRQITGDQKQARPQIKIRAVEDGDAKGADLRQGIIKNIEDKSKAGQAYDTAFEWSSAAGFGAWRVVTEYSEDDGWDQDIRIKEIPDALSTVWFDPDAKERDCRDAQFAFVEESISRDDFKARYPDADPIDFDSQFNVERYSTWCGEKSVRIAEYWRKVPVSEKVCLLSDGRTIKEAEYAEAQQQLEAEGVTCTRTRTIQTHKVVTSIVSGAEEIDGPHDWPGKRIPIIPCYGDRYFVDGKWVWSGLVRHAKDAARLVNYNITTGQEILSKQHKATPVLTAKMLEGAGIKQLWDSSNAVDLPYLPITPDSAMPGGPTFLSPPPVHAAFTQYGQMAIDLLKSSTGLHDASLGERSNETSGKAIIARQREGDTATFSYQDGLAFAIQSTGEVVLELLPSVYDTPRAVRVLGKDGGEDWQKINEALPDGTVLNDLSAGKYDVSVSTGPSFSTQRAEFADLMLNMAQGNPQLMAVAGDLVIGALDFPKAEEVAERLKMMLPPPIQQQLQQGKDMPPEVAQLQGQMQQMQQMAEQHIQEMQQEMQQLQAKAKSKDDAIMREVNAAKDRELAWYNAETARIAAIQKNAIAAGQVDQAAALELLSHMNNDADRQHEVGLKAMDQAHASITQAADQQHQAGMQQQAAELAPEPAEPGA
jgi:hypothetical protein